MRVVVAYAQLDHVTDSALRLCAPNAEREYVGDDDEAYWRLLCRLWADQEDFLLIEQDIVIDQAIVKAMDECPEPWCSVSSSGLYMDEPRKPFDHIKPESRRLAFMAQQNEWRKKLHGDTLPPYVDPPPALVPRRTWIGPFLQCNRFRRELMAGLPDLVTDTGERHWRTLDSNLLPRLEANCLPHPHPEVRTRHRKNDLQQAQWEERQKDTDPVKLAELRRLFGWTPVS